MFGHAPDATRKTNRLGQMTERLVERALEGSEA